MIPITTNIIEIKSESDNLGKLVHEYSITFFGITLFKRTLTCAEISSCTHKTSGFQVLPDQKQYVEDDTDFDE